ncbi:OmpH family outer membrane protein [Gemmatimonadota bacterium]
MSSTPHSPWKMYTITALIALVVGGFAGRHAPTVQTAYASDILWAAPGVTADALQEQEADIAPGAKPLKVGFLRSDLIMQLHPRIPEIRTALEAQLREWTRQQAELEGQVTTLQTDLRTGQLTPNTRRAKEAELAQAMEGLTTFQNEIWVTGGVAEQKETELMQPILAAIDVAITEIAEEEEFDLIFDSSGGGLLFGHRSLDLTRQVLESLGINPPPE